MGKKGETGREEGRGEERERKEQASAMRAGQQVATSGIEWWRHRKKAGATIGIGQRKVGGRGEKERKKLAGGRWCS